MFKALLSRTEEDKRRRWRLKSFLQSQFPKQPPYLYKHVIDLCLKHRVDLWRWLPFWSQRCQNQELKSFYYWLKAFVQLSSQDCQLLVAWSSSLKEKGFAVCSPKRFLGVGDKVFQKFVQYYSSAAPDQIADVLPLFIKAQADAAEKRGWSAFYENPGNLLAPLGWQDFNSYVLQNFGSWANFFRSSRSAQRQLSRQRQTAEAIFYLRSLALRLGRVDLADRIGRATFSPQRIVKLIREVEEECSKRGLTPPQF